MATAKQICIDIHNMSTAWRCLLATPGYMPGSHLEELSIAVPRYKGRTGLLRVPVAFIGVKLHRSPDPWGCLIIKRK